MFRNKKVNKSYEKHYSYDFTEYTFNFEIRVGEDGDDIGNNEICHKQINKVRERFTTIICSTEIFGDWVSINKTSDVPDLEFLALYEIKVYGK